MAVFDPGMADVGTGAAAAGTPMAPERIELARRTERRATPPPGDPGTPANASTGPRLTVVLMTAAALGIAAAVIGLR
ncbi:hypothetical protein E2C06_19910 [Dankookia rubra]|uniref:Uncharacterized protein n=1 Tax=Dankookia rubra TaxID=1442381 RepID=A0A4R5QD90_9PROT|nr:hypothetical protein [Dankookia rubra]TDH60886.1 hypothetical protein E2C06_19910 [Dankookia rubra]